MQELTSPYIQKRRKRRGGFFRFLLLFILFTSLAILLRFFLFSLSDEKEPSPILSSLLCFFGGSGDDIRAYNKEKDVGSSSSSAGTTIGFSLVEKEVGTGVNGKGGEVQSDSNSTICAVSYKEVDLSAGTLGYRYENRTDYALDNAFFVSADTSPSGSVLVVATRAYEAYRDCENGQSFEGRNMEALGREMATLLRENGVNALYLPLSKTGDDYSYEYAATLLDAYLKGHPNITTVLDLSRDTKEEDGWYLAPQTTYGGKKAAQIRFAVGTDAGGGEHPSWRSSLALVDSLFALLDSSVPSLMMPTLISSSRLNQHLPVRYLTLHIGSYGNTYEEAAESVSLFARVLASQFGGR